MSEQKEDSKDKEKQRLVETREKSQVEAVPRRQDFYEWLERLFDGSSQFPEKLECRAVSGKNFERLGPMVKQIIYPPKSPKPTREEIVSLSNQLLFLMQRDCDIQRKSVVYGIHVAHFSRDVDFYERWLHRCMPGAVHAQEGLPRPDDESGEGETFEGKYSMQMMGHHERLFGLYGGAFEGLLDRMDRVLERQDNRIHTQDDRIQKLSEMLERALSLEADRIERREWNQLKMRSIEKALDLGMTLAPPIIGSLMAKKDGAAPTVGQDSPEALTLRNFFKKKSEGGSLTDEQATIAFGGDDGKPGILSLDQTKLLWGISQCQLPVDDLDKLLPGGPLQVTMEQVMGLQAKAGFSLEQLAPIQLLFENRMKRRAKLQS